MKTSILIAFTALIVSFTATLAAPQGSGVSVHKIRTTNLKHLSLTKNLVTYPPTLPELIKLSQVAVGEITAAIDKAIKSLETLLAGTEIVDDVLAVAATARAQALRLIGEALVEALQGSVDEFGTKLEELIVNLAYLLLETDAEIRTLIGREDGALIGNLDDIVNQLGDDAGAAIKPILCAFYTPGTCDERSI